MCNGSGTYPVRGPSLGSSHSSRPKEGEIVGSTRSNRKVDLARLSECLGVGSFF